MILKLSAASERNLTWIKSSYSTPDGPACVEVAWTKSSYSGADTASCVEVAATHGTIHIRDSKNPTGPRLAVPGTAWTAFLRHASAH